MFEDQIGLRFQSHLAELQKFQTKEKMYESNQVEKFINSSCLASPLQRIPPIVNVNICNKYGKIFMHPSLLPQHLKTHISEKPYQCNDCDKSFRQNPNLTSYERIHSRQRPYKCNEFGKAFIPFSNLVDIRESTPERNCKKCNVCGKGCSQNSNLAIHKNIHTGEKPY